MILIFKKMGCQNYSTYNLKIAYSIKEFNNIYKILSSNYVYR